jgi:hypothetical protein
LLAGSGFLAAAGIRTFLSFRPAAITVGPSTTFYFRSHPPVVTRVHEAIHRRQMRDEPTLGRIWKALRYNFDYGYRLNEEAEAKAGEICLQIHRFNPELSAYTTARSLSQARAYRAWAWERMGVSVPDRVGEKLQGGENCHRILRGVELDLPAGEALSQADSVKLATFRFLQAYGSTDREVETWKARLELAGYVEPAHWDVPEDVPPFGLVAIGRGVAAPPDTSISPGEAGSALHRLTYSTAERMPVQLRPPPPGYRGRPVLWPGDADEGVGIPLDQWPDRILARGLHGDLDEEEIAWLEGVASHPLHDDFETFALAPTADVIGGRYRIPFDERWSRLVFSDIGPVREAFRSQWGRAALRAQRGDLEGARHILRIVVAGALQLVENAPFEVDVVEGLDVLDQALRSLRQLDRHEGLDTPWLAEYRNVSAASWMRGARSVLFSEDPSALYRAMPALAGDPGIPHAFRRFAFRQVLLTDVCLERRKEPDVWEAHSRWRAGVEAGLVRRPSDWHVLDLMRRSARRVLVASDVPPELICSATGSIRAGARMAIMEAPLRRATETLAEDRD